MTTRCPTCGTLNKTKTYQEHGCLTCKAKQNKPKHQKPAEDPLALNLKPEDHALYLKQRQKVIEKEPTNNPQESLEHKEIPTIKTFGLRQALGLVKNLTNNNY
jgi:hypothetical protein